MDQGERSGVVVREPARETPVAAEVDVCVAGSGPAGIAAAVAAARGGAKTLLVERDGCLGGMLTSGGVQNIRTYNDGRRQVIGGVPAEIAERIRKAGGTTQGLLDAGYVRQEPEVTKYVLQELALESGAGVLLHAVVAGALVESGAVKGLLIESKSGRQAVRCRVAIDASGDGDLIAQSGAAFEKTDGMLQPMTLTCIIGGVKGWPVVRPPAMQEAIRAALKAGTFPINRSPALFAMDRAGYVYANATRIPGDCSDAGDLTRGEIEGRRQVWRLLEWLRANVPEYGEAFIAATGSAVGLRESRRLKGVYTLTRDDVIQAREFDDAIARCSYDIDIHHNDSGGERTTLGPGRSYGIPYRCLVPVALDGLLAAGRCLSCSHDALGSVRVMAPAMATGEAAGTAAAMAARTGAAVRAVDVAELRRRLNARGAII